MIRTTILLIALAFPTLAQAHSFWLEPETHAAEQGQTVAVDFKVGDKEDVNDWGLYWERIGALQSFGPAGVSDQQAAVRVTGGTEIGTARVSLKGEGTHILAFSSNPSFSKLEAGRFNRYLEHEGLSGIAQHREAMRTTAKAGTELYARRAKTLIQIGAKPSGNVAQPIGQTLEIVPLENPLELGDKTSLGVKVLWRGQPLAEATLGATALSAPGQTKSFTTNAQGIVDVPLNSSERYLLSVVWGEPAPNDSRADYFTIFSSLTFARN